jgi:signal transduction histidine kinase
LIRDHHGEISVDCGDSGGTKVTVTLPVVQDDAQDKREESGNRVGP